MAMERQQEIPERGKRGAACRITNFMLTAHAAGAKRQRSQVIGGFGPLIAWPSSIL